MIIKHSVETFQGISKDGQVVSLTTTHSQMHPLTDYNEKLKSYSADLRRIFDLVNRLNIDRAHEINDELKLLEFNFDDSLRALCEAVEAELKKTSVVMQADYLKINGNS